MTNLSKPNSFEHCALTNDELDCVVGGVFQSLSSIISNVMKNFDEALQKVDRGG